MINHLTTNERDKLIELLTRFSQEYCCEECDYANCDTCEFNDRGCCQMINSISHHSGLCIRRCTLDGYGQLKDLLRRFA